MQYIIAGKNLLLALLKPILVVFFLLGFVFLNDHKIMFYVYSIITGFIVIITLSKLMEDGGESDPVFIFLGVSSEPEGVTYQAVKDYLSSISTIAFSFTVMIFSNKSYNLMDNNYFIFILSVFTLLLLFYSALCLIEFIYRCVGIDHTCKTVLVGVPALVLQLLFLEVGINSTPSILIHGYIS